MTSNPPQPIPKSVMDQLASLSKAERDTVLADLPDDVIVQMANDWRFLARPDQLPPAAAFLVWLIIGGRGAGKSRTVCEWAHDRIIAHYAAEADGNRTLHRIGAGSRSGADGRDVLVEGESGLLAVAERRGIAAKYEPSKRRITWPDLNARCTMFSAEEPDQARGPQYHTVIGDEFAAWDFSITDDLGNNLWTNLLFGLRLGMDPQAALSTTPKRVSELRKLVTRAVDEHDADVVMSRSSTMANAANLAAQFLEQVVSQYEGTRLYKQEVLGILLDDDESALWTDESITLAHRFLNTTTDWRPKFTKKVVAVDPPAKISKDHCGIVGVGMLDKPLPGLKSRCAAVIADRSLRGTPERWGAAVVQLCRELGTSLVVAESNQGGEMVRHVIQSSDPVGDIKVELVSATVSKRLRAEPVSLLYEQQRVVHLDRFQLLEDEMVSWSEDEDSPDRLDALVHGMTHLIPDLGRRPSQIASPMDIDLSAIRQAALVGPGNPLDPMYRAVRNSQMASQMWARGIRP